MLRTTVVLSLAGALVSCGDDELDPAPLAEQCGVVGPTPLLELKPEQLRLSTRRIGDRLYHSLVHLDPDATNQFPQTGRELWSTGPCGESPRLVAKNVSNPVIPDRWPDLLLACQADVGLVTLDPEGTTPPHLVFKTSFCGGAWTDFGLLALDQDEDDILTLLLYPYPDDPRTATPEPRVLVDEVLVPQTFGNLGEVVHIINAQYELLRIDLADLGSTVVQTNVRDYAYSPDQRYLLWRDAAVIGGDPDHPEGSVLLRDTQTGTSAGLGSTASAFLLNARWLDDDHLVVWQDDHDRIYSLPGLDFFDLDAGGQLLKPLPDGRLLVRNEQQGDWLGALDLDDHSFTPLFSRRAQILILGDDALTVLDAPCCTPDPFRTQGKVWSVPLDGSPATVLADRATLSLFRPDPTRLLTIVDRTSGAGPGTILLVDTDTRREHIVADDVIGWSLPDYEDRTLLTYSAVDGDHSTIWQLRLAPAP